MMCEKKLLSQGKNGIKWRLEIERGGFKVVSNEFMEVGRSKLIAWKHENTCCIYC